MKRIITITIVFLTLCTLKSYSQSIARFNIQLANAVTDAAIPASISLDEFTFLPDSLITLWLVNGNNKIQIPFQVKQGSVRTLHWLITHKYPVSKSKTLSYVLENGKMEKASSIQASMDNGALTIHSGNQNLLRYQYQTLYPPVGVDTNYKRSAFIHPLWSPHGQELTRIQPKDHYHHYGIWNPWTHTVFEKDTVDFWNIAAKKGTVRFSKFISQINGPVFSEFEALQEHVVFKKDGTEKIALNELQTVRVYNPQGNKDYFIVDITSQLSCATNNPLLIVAYRYGGFGWRTTEKWDNKNSEVITSEGKNRKDADGSKAKWCIVQGSLGDNDYGGVVMLSYPGNYNHPEPLRIGPENQYNRGDMFANFATTKDKDWLLEPGKTYVLKYRLLVYNGNMTKERA
ncbi:MAG: DUF6807 domain-containing protein, partial [Chitinophagaceae bacterium]